MLLTYRNLGHSGRLGNQLFQIASTIGIAHHEDANVVFPSNWHYRPFFSLPDEMFSDDIPEVAVESTAFADHLDPRARSYLQDYSLFENHIEEICEYLRPSGHAAQRMNEVTDFYADLGLSYPVLGVHVRRGDNVFDPGVPNKGDYHLCPDLAYYKRAIAMFPPPANTHVFSDDIEWCREHIPADKYGTGIPYMKEHEEGYAEVEPLDWIDLQLLSDCDWFVITGSTFGIWGALLSGSSHVVRPDQVYGPLVADHVDCNLMFPSNWTVARAS